MLQTSDDIGHAVTFEEESALISACLQSRSRSLYPAVMLALNSGMRYGEIRLLQWRQLDFGSNVLTVTTADQETFLTAPGAPEAHDLLRVRMGGWTEMFVAMHALHQKVHPRRPYSS